MAGDPRTPRQIAEDEKLAATYSEPGSLKNAMLRLGFMPHGDDDAFKILKSIVEENERLRREAGND
jgi:hypothetical protein